MAFLKKKSGGPGKGGKGDGAGSSGGKGGLADGIIRIKRAAAEFMCQAASNVYPDEFIADLRMDKDVITEVIILPDSIYGNDFSVVNDWMRPINMKSGGSVHSHPDENNNPSRQDVRAFSKEGGVHLIIGYPYELENIAAYDANGKPLPVKIVR